MNKNFMILAASAVMLASCSNDETVDLVKGDAIQFRTAVNSRGAVLDNSTLRKFVVSAYDSGGKTYFSNAVFSGYSSNFTSDNDYCWPVNGGTLDFTAYAPVGLKDVITTPTGVTINGFTPPTQIKDHVDLITAIASGSSAMNGTSGVALSFKHHLAQIEVEAYTGGKGGYKYYVKGVRIGRVKGTANFNSAEISNDLNLDQNGWDFGEEPVSGVNYITEYEEPLTITPAGDGAVSVMGTAGNALVIPQELTGWTPNAYGTSFDGGSYLAVKLRVETSEGALVYPAKTDYDWVAVPIDGEWKAGKRYTYSLYFSDGNFGYVDPEKGLDPEAPYDPDAKPKADNDDPFKPGKTVEGNPIKLTSTMTDWEDDYDNGGIVQMQVY